MGGIGLPLAGSLQLVEPILINSSPLLLRVGYRLQLLDVLGHDRIQGGLHDNVTK